MYTCSAICGTCSAVCGGSSPAAQTHWVSVVVTRVVPTQGVCEDTVLGAVGLVVVGRAVPLVPQEQVYSTASTTAVHICVIVIVFGRVVEVGVAVVYDSIVGSILVNGLEEQLVVVLHKRVSKLLNSR